LAATADESVLSAAETEMPKPSELISAVLSALTVTPPSLSMAESSTAARVSLPMSLIVSDTPRPTAVDEPPWPSVRVRLAAPATDSIVESSVAVMLMAGSDALLLVVRALPPRTRAWVLLRTGWSRRDDPAAFLNVSDDGPHSPGFHASTSTLLAKDRDVLGVGVETVGTDAGQAGTFDPPFPNHGIMHGAGKFGLASLRNLEQLPPTGAIVIAAPLKLVGGSGSPLRVLAIAPA